MFSTVLSKFRIVLGHECIFFIFISPLDSEAFNSSIDEWTVKFPLWQLIRNEVSGVREAEETHVDGNGISMDLSPVTTVEILLPGSNFNQQMHCFYQGI